MQNRTIHDIDIECVHSAHDFVLLVVILETNNAIGDTEVMSNSFLAVKYVIKGEYSKYTFLWLTTHKGRMILSLPSSGQQAQGSLPSLQIVLRRRLRLLDMD